MGKHENEDSQRKQATVHVAWIFVNFATEAMRVAQCVHIALPLPQTERAIMVLGLKVLENKTRGDPQERRRVCGELRRALATRDPKTSVSMYIAALVAAAHPKMCAQSCPCCGTAASKPPL